MTAEQLRARSEALGFSIEKDAKHIEDDLAELLIEEFSKEAISFSYALESVSSQSKKTKILDSKSIVLLSKTENKFYSRYKVSKDSNSIGLVLTNIDLGRIGRYGNGEPIFWQMGRERRKLALAQRALFFDENHNTQIYKKLIKRDWSTSKR